MPIWLHLVLMLISQMVGFFLGLLSGWSTAQFLLSLLQPWLLSLSQPWTHWVPDACLILVVVGAFLFAWIPKFIFYQLLWARCPEPGCDGAAYCCCPNPIMYECQRCGYLHETWWSYDEGSSL